MDRSRPHNNHLAEGDIAALIEGTLSERARNSVFTHIRSCERCAAVCRDSALFTGLWEGDGDAFLSLGRAEKTGRSGGRALAGWLRRSWMRGRFRVVVAGTATAMIATIIVLATLTPRPGEDGIDASIVAPVRAAAETFCSRGPFVLPGGEGGIGRSQPVYRSGHIEPDDAMNGSLEQLSVLAEGEKSPADAAYWLAAGYLVTGQIDAALIASEIAAINHTDDYRFEVLLGLASYDKRDFDKAVQHLQRALRLEPGEPAAMLNLAIVLSETGDTDGARELLAAIVRDNRQSPLSRRAGRLLSDLE
jgi:tetratricopeptide (TPR) repeat protein